MTRRFPRPKPRYQKQAAEVSIQTLPERHKPIVVDVNQLYQQSTECYLRSDFINALYLSKRALSIDPHFAKAQFRLGTIHMIDGNHKKAEQYFKMFLRNAKRENNESLIAEAHNMLGTLFDRDGHMDRAISYYEDALKIYEKQRNQNQIAKLYNNLGCAYRRKYELKSSLYYYEKALTLSKRNNDKQKMAFFYFNLAYLYKAQGKIFKASHYIKKYKILDYQIYGEPEILREDVVVESPVK